MHRLIHRVVGARRAIATEKTGMQLALRSACQHISIRRQATPQPDSDSIDLNHMI